MKKVISVFLSTALLSNMVFAESMADYIRMQVDTTPSQSYRTDNIIGFSGGDMRMRFGGSQSVKLPISVQAPRVSVGCGGIDSEFGGLAFLKENLVKLFQNITSVAPAFAFQLALKTLCSQCSATLQELQQIANQFNSLSFDGCANSSAMVNFAYASMQKAGMIEKTPPKEQGYLSEYLGNGSGGNVISDYLSEAQKWLSGKGVAEPKKVLTTLQGSWLEKSLDPATKSRLNTLLDNKALPIMRAMVGDVYGYMGDTEPVYKPIDAIWNANEIRRFVGVEADGSTELRVIAISNPSLDTDAYPPPAISQMTIDFVGLKTIFKEPIARVLTTLGTPGGTLDAADLNFIAAMPLPIYKVLNNEILAKGYGNADVDELSEFIASQQALAILELVVGAAQKSIASFKMENVLFEGQDGKQLELTASYIHSAFFTQLNESAKTIRNVIGQQYESSMKQFIAKREQKIQIRKIEQEIKTAIAKTSLYQKSTLVAF